MRSQYAFGRSLIAIALAMALASPSIAQLNFSEWQPADAQDWNVPANWEFNSNAYVPDSDMFAGESARINNGGTAIVSGSVPRVANIDVLNGGIDIQGGGDLEAVNDGVGTGSLLIAGAGVVDLTSNAMLDLAGNLSGGGTLNLSGTSQASVGGDRTAGVVNLNDSAQLSVAGTFSGGGPVQLTGPSALLSVGGNFAHTGNLIAGITDASSHSLVSVTGQATLNGALSVNFSNGVSPSIGDSWDVISAGSISGKYASVNATGNLPAGVGLFFQTQAGGLGTLGQVTADVQLVLSVNRQSGATSIQNLVAGENVELDGYLITSPSADVLNPGAWTSFRDAGDTNWTESNPGPNSLGELNLTNSGTMSGATNFPLGAIYEFNPSAIGEPEPGLTFEYHVPGGETRVGQVQFEGGRNNIVLSVDPTTGEAAIRNESTFDVDIDGYLITSSSSALDPTGWQSLSTSLPGEGWTESNPAANHLGELNLTGMLDMLPGGSSVELGALFDFDGVDIEQDLEFEFHIAGGETVTGLVEYAAFSSGGGDFDNDGDIDGADFLKWQRDGLSSSELLGWQNSYGSGSLAASSAVSAVPEPGSVVLLTLGSLALFGVRRQA